MTSRAPRSVAAIVAKLSTCASSGRTHATGTPERETIADIFALVRALNSWSNFRNASAATGIGLPPGWPAMRPSLFSTCSRNDGPRADRAQGRSGTLLERCSQITNNRGLMASSEGNRAGVPAHRHDYRISFTDPARGGRVRLRGPASGGPCGGRSDSADGVRLDEHEPERRAVRVAQHGDGLRLPRGSDDRLRRLRRKR